MFHQPDSKVRDVNPDPVALQALSYGDGGATAAERVEDDIVLIAPCFYDPRQQFLGLLRRVAQSLFGGWMQECDRPDIACVYALRGQAAATSRPRCR